MESLASLFVTLVTVVNSVFPQANLPQVLGVQTSSDDFARGRVTANVGEVRKAQEEFKQKRETAAQEVNVRREELKEKLKIIKDERKKRIVDNIDKKLSAVNGRWVDHWNQVLIKLATILTKIDSESQALSNSGVDTKALDLLVSSADKSILDAQSAINTQAGKSYSIQITTEGKLGSDVRAVTSQFRSGIESTRNQVMAAKKATEEAYKFLKSLKGGSNSNEKAQ